MITRIGVSVLQEAGNSRKGVKRFSVRNCKKQKADRSPVVWETVPDGHTH
jgi:hypothetical protein